MKQVNLTDIYLVNSLGQVIRSFVWSDKNIVLVKRRDTGRVQAVANIKGLEKEGISFEVLGESTIAQLKKKPISLGKFGELRYQMDTSIEISPSIYGEKEDLTGFQRLLKRTALVHVLILAFILAFSWTYQSYFKETQEVVQVQPKFIKTVVAKKLRRVPRKIVKARKKKIHRKKRPTIKYSKKRRTTKIRSKLARKRPGKKKRQRIARNVRSMGALGALGGLSRGQRGARGLNLNSIKSFAGSGSNAGLKSKGSSTAFLNGRGLLAQSAGGGKTVRNKYGYGTKGRAGGASGYGKHTIAGGSGSYFHPLQELGNVASGLERSQIAAVINRNIGQVIYCYEKGLQKQPRLSGRVAVDFTISGSGRVSTANVSKSSLKHYKVERCITNKLKAWRFPKPHGRVNVNVTYPFILKRVSQG